MSKISCEKWFSNIFFFLSNLTQYNILWFVNITGCMGNTEKENYYSIFNSIKKLNKSILIHGFNKEK